MCLREDLAPDSCRSASATEDSTLAVVAHSVEFLDRPSSISNRHSVVLTIGDRFSKSVHYVLLAKLCSCSMLSGCIGSCRIMYQIEALSSHLECGGPFAQQLE